jgi:hypothetical protein
MKSIISKAIVFLLACLFVCCGVTQTDSEIDGYDSKDGSIHFSVFEAKNFELARSSCQKYFAVTPGPRLVLQPVTIWSSKPVNTCSERGVETIRVWLFRDSQVVIDEELPCICDMADVGTVEPGEYRLALMAESSGGIVSVAGLILIEGEYVPEYQHCDQYSVYRGCPAIDVTVGKDLVTIMQADLFCHDMLSGGMDICGGP